jgi:hypothetical protein
VWLSGVLERVPAKKKAKIRISVFVFVFLDTLYIKNACIPIYLIYLIYGGGWGAGGFFGGQGEANSHGCYTRSFFLCCRRSRESNSHGCYTRSFLLMSRNEPGARGSQGEGIPTVATPNHFFLMPQNEPRRQGKPGGRDSHDCCTPDRAGMPGCYLNSHRSPIPAIYHIGNNRWAQQYPQ